MIVLFLDLSKTATGWAVDGLEGDCPPRTGTWKPPLQGMKRGPFGHAFQQWLYRRLIEWDVDLVAYESPKVAQRFDTKPGQKKIIITADIMITLCGMAFSVDTIAAARGIQSYDGAESTIRKEFIGHGRPPDGKAAVRRHCETLGWPVANNDESDAAAGWYWAKCKHDPSFRPEQTDPLFRQKGAA